MAEETFTDNDEFELLPAGDEDLLSADAQLAAAEASLTDDAFATDSSPAPIPFGKSWAWDRERQRYKRGGSSAAPQVVYGKDSLREWIGNALCTAQGGSPIFSDEFGIEEPDDWIGLADPGDAIATFEPRAREAVTQHDRVRELDELDPEFDPDEGVVTVSNILVVTDEAEAVPLLPFDISPTGF